MVGTYDSSVAFEKYTYELKNEAPKVPFVLLGCKTDLRDDPETIERLASRNMKPFSFEMGSEIAKKMGAEKYMECSSLHGTGIQEAMDQMVQIAMEPPRSKTKKKGYLSSIWRHTLGGLFKKH